MRGSEGSGRRARVLLELPAEMRRFAVVQGIGDRRDGVGGLEQHGLGAVDAGAQHNLLGRLLEAFLHAAPEGAAGKPAKAGQGGDPKVGGAVGFQESQSRLQVLESQRARGELLAPALVFPDQPEQRPQQGSAHASGPGGHARHRTRQPQGQRLQQGETGRLQAEGRTVGGQHPGAAGPRPGMEPQHRDHEPAVGILPEPVAFAGQAEDDRAPAQPVRPAGVRQFAAAPAHDHEAMVGPGALGHLPAMAAFHAAGHDEVEVNGVLHAAGLGFGPAAPAAAVTRQAVRGQRNVSVRRTP